MAITISQLIRDGKFSVHYAGEWDASTTVYPAAPQPGDIYTVSVSGTVSTITYTVGENIIYDGNSWIKIGSGGSGGASIGTWDVTATVVPGTVDDPIIVSTTSNISESAGILTSNFGSSSGFGNPAIAVALTNYTFVANASTSFRVGLDISSIPLANGTVVGVGIAPSTLSATDVQANLLSMFGSTTSGESLFQFAGVQNIGSPNLIQAVDSGGTISGTASANVTSLHEAESSIVAYYGVADLGAGDALYPAAQFLNAAGSSYELAGYSSGFPLSTIAGIEFRVYYTIVSIDVGSGWSNRSITPNYTDGSTTVVTTGTTWETSQSLTQTDFDNRHPNALVTAQAITPDSIIEADYPLAAANNLYEVTNEGPKDGQFMCVSDLVYFDTDTTFKNLSAVSSGIIDMSNSVIDYALFTDVTDGITGANSNKDCVYLRAAGPASITAVTVADNSFSGAGDFYCEFKITDYAYTDTGSFLGLGFAMSTAADINSYLDTLSGTVAPSFYYYTSHAGTASGGLLFGRTSSSSYEPTSFGSAFIPALNDSIGVRLITSSFPSITIQVYRNSVLVGTTTFSITNTIITAVNDLVFKPSILASSPTVGDSITLTIPSAPVYIPVGSTYTVTSSVVIPTIHKSKVFTVSGSGVLLGSAVADGDVVYIDSTGTAIKNLSYVPPAPPADGITYFYKSVSDFNNRTQGILTLFEDQQLVRSSSLNIDWNNNNYSQSSSSINYTTQAGNGLYQAHFSTSQNIFAPGAVGFCYTGDLHITAPPAIATTVYKSYIAIADVTYADAASLIAAYTGESIQDFALVAALSYDTTISELNITMRHFRNGSLINSISVNTNHTWGFNPFCITLDKMLRKFSLHIPQNTTTYQTELSLDLDNLIDINSLSTNNADTGLRFYFYQDFEVNGSTEWGLIRSLSTADYNVLQDAGYSDIFAKIQTPILNLIPPSATGKIVKYADIGYGAREKYLPLITATNTSFIVQKIAANPTASIGGQFGPDYRARYFEMIDTQKCYVFTGADLVPLDGERILGVIEKPFKSPQYAFDYDFDTNTPPWDNLSITHTDSNPNGVLNTDYGITVNNANTPIESVTLTAISGTTFGTESTATITPNITTMSLSYLSESVSLIRTKTAGEQSGRREVVISPTFGDGVTDGDVEFMIGVYDILTYATQNDFINAYIAGTATKFMLVSMTYENATGNALRSVVHNYDSVSYSTSTPSPIKLVDNYLKDQYIHIYKSYINEQDEFLHIELFGNHAAALKGVPAASVQMQVPASDIGGYQFFYAVKIKEQTGPTWPAVPSSLKVEYGCSSPYASKLYNSVNSTTLKWNEAEYMYTQYTPNASIMANIASPFSTSDLYAGITESQFSRFSSPVRRFSVVFAESLPSAKQTYGDSVTLNSPYVSTAYKEAGGKLILHDNSIATYQYEILNKQDPACLLGTNVTNFSVQQITNGSESVKFASEPNTLVSETILSAYVKNVDDRGTISTTITQDFYDNMLISRPAQMTLATGGDVTINIYWQNAGGNVSYQEMIFIIINGGTGTVTWPGSITWAGGTPPTLTSSGTNIVKLIFIDGVGLCGRLEI